MRQSLEEEQRTKGVVALRGNVSDLARVMVVGNGDTEDNKTDCFPSLHSKMGNKKPVWYEAPESRISEML